MHMDIYTVRVIPKRLRNTSKRNHMNMNEKYTCTHHSLFSPIHRFNVVLKRPSNEDYMWSVYTKQFEASIWAVLAVLTGFLFFCLYFASQRSSCEQKLSPSDTFIAGAGMIFGQGTCVVVGVVWGSVCGLDFVCVMFSKNHWIVWSVIIVYFVDVILREAIRSANTLSNINLIIDFTKE